MANPKTPGDKQQPDPHPGMMGDGTEEQNLNQPGNPDARVTEADVKEAFGTDDGAKDEAPSKT